MKVIIKSKINVIETQQGKALLEQYELITKEKVVHMSYVIQGNKVKVI